MDIVRTLLMVLSTKSASTTAPFPNLKSRGCTSRGDEWGIEHEIMEKDFNKWNENKKHIHAEAENKLYHRQEVWWCSLGVNVGFEQDGVGVEHQRPVLIIKGFSKNTCLIVPLTTSLKKHPLRIPIGLVDGKQASALLSQVRIIDTKRLINKIDFVGGEFFEIIRKAVKELL